MHTVKFYRGDYRQRQRAANQDGCLAYVEHHFNSGGNADYAVVVTGANASPTSKNWGRWYAGAVAREFGIDVGGDRGIVVGGYGGRGDGNIRYTDMPALLLEPLFASNAQHAEWIRGADGQGRLAQILCESIQRFFPDDGVIGFSVGHKYKTSNPSDRGAAVVGGGWEADYAEKVLQRAATLLQQSTPLALGRQVRVLRGDAVEWSGTIDEDADVRWDPVREALIIRESGPSRSTPRLTQKRVARKAKRRAA